MYVVGKLYNNLKEDYLLTVNDVDIIKLDELQRQCIAEKVKAKEAEDRAIAKEESYQTKETELLQLIVALEKENKRLNDELDSQKDLKQEVIKLRNVVFTALDTEEDISSDVIEDSNIDFLNNKRTVILGGHPSWVNDMKKVLPNATFWGVEARNTSMDFIRSDSLVFINTRTKHSVYYKVKEIVSKVGAKYFYINNNANIELTKKEILASLENPME